MEEGRVKIAPRSHSLVRRSAYSRRLARVSCNRDSQLCIHLHFTCRFRQVKLVEPTSAYRETMCHVDNAYHPRRDRNLPISTIGLRESSLVCRLEIVAVCGEGRCRDECRLGYLCKDQISRVLLKIS